jgi:hypothetical protein
MTVWTNLDLACQPSPNALSESRVAAWHVAPLVREREAETMSLYLSKFSYTPETWARLIRNPEVPTVDETIDALRRAEQVQYQVPGA